MMAGAMPKGLPYPGAASVAGLVQLEDVKADWKLSLDRQTQTDTDRHRQTGRKTDRQTDR